MGVDVDRRVFLFAAIDVNAFDLARPVLQPQRLAQNRPRDCAVGGTAGVHLLAVGGIDRLVVGVIERLLVHVEPNERPLGALKSCSFCHNASSQELSTAERILRVSYQLQNCGPLGQPHCWWDFPAGADDPSNTGACTHKALNVRVG